MSRLGDDLQKAKVGLLHVLDGATQLEQAATAVVQKVDAVAGHLAAPETLGRVAAAGLGAALAAAGREVQIAAATPPPPTSRPPRPPPRNVTGCRRHGEQPWARTIVCTACGRVFQVLDASAAHFAPEVCPCGVQLLPAPHVTRHSATPICTPCFTGIAASGGRAVRRTE
ncbi:MAG: hypothetical protein ABI134_16230 [Byssovorax sp.]